MRSLGAGAVIGNINMRGKKYLLLGCKCCAMRDLRARIRDALHRKEIREALEGERTQEVMRDATPPP